MSLDTPHETVIDLRNLPSPTPITRNSPPHVGIVGLGYVGLPTALAFAEAGVPVTGVDVSPLRLAVIAAEEADLVPEDRDRLTRALRNRDVRFGSDPEALLDTDVIIVCVPTPVDEHQTPDLAPLAGAVATVVAGARPGQTIVLTSTTYVGCTRQMLLRPLEERGMRVGIDVHVAFSPERIDPANTRFGIEQVPRVLGGITPACTEAARRCINLVSPLVHLVSSPEAAEMTKLLENTFRAVNIALANEIADVSRTLELDPLEVIEAAATKPYGFMPFFPGPGVGGHCIPCDPQYLLWQLRARRTPAPVIESAMNAILTRPMRVVERAVEVLGSAGRPVRGAYIVLAGVAYKPGVADLRESPALPIMEELRRLGAHVAFWDPMVDSYRNEEGDTVQALHEPDPAADLVIVHTVHPGVDYGWVRQHPLVLDATYRLEGTHHVP